MRYAFDNAIGGLTADFKQDFGLNQALVSGFDFIIRKNKVICHIF